MPPDTFRGADGLCGVCGEADHGFGCPASDTPAEQALEHWARYQAAKELHPAIRRRALTVEQRRELLRWDRAIAAVGVVGADGKYALTMQGQRAG